MLIAQSSIILIVNTQSKDTNVLVGFLQELGCKILVTNTGERALEKLQNVLPDLILMDVIMPGMDGFETCRRLKASTKTKDIPVIFITASSESIDKIKGLKVGAVDYITKPFQPEEVLPRLENQIKISKLQKQIEEQNRKLEQETNTRRQLEERLKLVITERNRVEERNRALLNAIPDPIIRQHVDGTFLDVRAKEGDLIVPTQTLIGTNVSDLPIPDAVKQGLIECLQTAVATGELQIYEYELQMPNGVRTYESRFVKSGTDEAIRIVRDVTERKRAEAALRQSEARFRGIFENAAITIALSKADGTVIAVNPTYEAFLGYSENDIKLRELALKESQRRFRAIFNNSFQFTAVLTPDGTVIEVNQTALDFAGVKPADVTGLPFWETCWWREGVSEQGSRGYFGAGEAGETYRRVSELSVKQEQLREAIATAASGQFVRYEVDIRGVGDSAIAIDFSIKPVLDETGNVVLLIPEGRDITERKKVEQRLRLFESAVVNANDAILIAEAEPISLPGPRIIYVNEAFTRMTGYSAEEVIGQTPRLLQGEKTDRTQLDRVRHALQTWQSVRVELINYRKDGSQFWVELEIVPVADETGWFTHWVSVQRDITERKLAEAALRESEARFRAIFEYAAVGISKVTLSGQFLQVNQRLCQLYGYTESELLALTFQEITYPIDLDADLKYWQQLLAGEIPSYSLEKRYVRKDGQILWGNLSVSVVCDSAGVPQYALGVMEDISERKQAEIALRDSEERWQLVLKGNNDVIWDVNLKTNEVFFSPRWKEMLGYEDQEIANHNDEWLTRIHPDDLDRVIQSNQNYFNQKTPNYTVEYRLRCKDGNYKWILGRAQAVWDEAGNPVRLVGSNRDISDRKRAEEALQQSEARLQKLAANVPGMLYEFVRHPDGSYRFAYVSSGCREINEFEPEQLLENMALGFEIVHPDDAPRLVESIKISAQTLEPWVWEGRIITPSGKLKWTRGAARPERCANGDILWHGLVVDVSDRKRTEIELRAAKTALEQQIERVLLSERITQEIRSSLKPQQIFQTAAIQISQAFGVDRCLIHIYIEHPTPQIPFVAEYKQAAIESILDREVPVLGNPHAELLLTQDQAVATYNVYADPVLKAASSLCQQIGLKSMLAVRTSYQGKPNGLIALHQCDSFRHWRAQEIELIESLGAQLGIAIAQANLLEQEKQRRRELAAQNHALEKAKQQAEAANQAKSHFLSKMSHELRTPLNAILGFSQVMARDKSLKTEQRDYLDIINRSGEHLLALINDILSMSKIEAGQVTLNKNRFDLYRLLDSMEEMLQLKAASSGIELLFERTKDVPRYIETDESKLRQVLINLLGNALKFTQVGSVTLRVRMGNRDRSLDISTSKAKPLGLAGRSSNIGNTEEVQPTPVRLSAHVEPTPFAATSSLLPNF
jgi:PAS domain S-box-containing protein